MSPLRRPRRVTTDEERRRLLAPKRVIMQLVGFALGIALLAWCISIAWSGTDTLVMRDATVIHGDLVSVDDTTVIIEVTDDDGEPTVRELPRGTVDRIVRGSPLEKLKNARPGPVIGLLGFTLLSFAMNGAMFWIVIQPLRRVGLMDMVLLNLVTTLLNFAPIRLGLVSRVLYNMRVDRLGILQIGAWFTALTSVLIITVTAAALATFLRPSIDVWWAGLAAGMAISALLVLRSLMGVPLVVRHARGMEVMLRDPRCLWGSFAFRIVDVAAFVGRMGCAAMILDLSLSLSDTMLLGMAALFFSLNPVGRIGLREAVVAFLATTLVGGGTGAERIEADMAALALIDSAGEALAAVPLGGLALVWYRRRWIQAKENGDDGADDAGPTGDDGGEP